MAEVPWETHLRNLEIAQELSKVFPAPQFFYFSGGVMVGDIHGLPTFANCEPDTEDPSEA